MVSLTESMKLFYVLVSYNMHVLVLPSYHELVLWPRVRINKLQLLLPGEVSTSANQSGDSGHKISEALLITLSLLSNFFVKILLVPMRQELALEMLMKFPE